jgi:hypothetical protein
LATFGMKTTHFSNRRHVRQLIFALILLIHLTSDVGNVSAASASAPLAITVMVVRSCNVTTIPSPYSGDSANIKPDRMANPIVTVVCPYGFDSAITVRSENYARDAAKTLTRFGMLTDVHDSRLGTAPRISGEKKLLSLPEPIGNLEKLLGRDHMDSVTVTVNF